MPRKRNEELYIHWDLIHWDLEPQKVCLYRIKTNLEETVRLQALQQRIVRQCNSPQRTLGEVQKVPKAAVGKEEGNERCLAITRVY